MGKKILNVVARFLDEVTRREHTVEKSFTMNKWREEELAFVTLSVQTFLQEEQDKFCRREMDAEYSCEETERLMGEFVNQIVHEDGVTGSTRLNARSTYIIFEYLPDGRRVSR